MPGQLAQFLARFRPGSIAPCDSIGLGTYQVPSARVASSHEKNRQSAAIARRSSVSWDHWPSSRGSCRAPRSTGPGRRPVAVRAKAGIRHHTDQLKRLAKLGLALGSVDDRPCAIDVILVELRLLFVNATVECDRRMRPSNATDVTLRPRAPASDGGAARFGAPTGTALAKCRTRAGLQ